MAAVAAPPPAPPAKARQRRERIGHGLLGALEDVDESARVLAVLAGVKERVRDARCTCAASAADAVAIILVSSTAKREILMGEGLKAERA